MKFDKKLKKILLDAYENVPYYHNLFSGMDIDVYSINSYEDFQKIPLLNKEILKNNQTDFISKNINMGELVTGYTSGSTGEVLKVYWSKKDIYRADIGLWRMRKRFGILPSSKICTLLFDTECKYGEDVFYINKNSIDINIPILTKENFYRMWEKLNEFSPDYIVSTPSLILMFINIAKSSNVIYNNDIKYIELCGEFLSGAVKSEIQSFYKKAKIINQYGCREARLIGLDCEMGNMHQIEQNVFIEFLADGEPVKVGEKGKIYITSLNNYSMPLIRYELGDIGCFTNTNCECGDNRKIISISAGRDNDDVKMRDQSKVSSVVFWGAVNYINQKMNNCIISFSVIQKDFEHFSIGLIIRENSNKNEIEKYFEQYMYQFPQYTIWVFSYEYCKSIKINEKSGKLCYFISEVF